MTSDGTGTAGAVEEEEEETPQMNVIMTIVSLEESRTLIY